MTSPHPTRLPRLAAALSMVVVVAAACSGAVSTAPGSSPRGTGGGPGASIGPSVGPSASAIPSATIPGPSPTGSAAASAQPSPSLDAMGCPTGTPDLATVRDVARAGHAIACFGSQPLTFRAYVPATEGLGGVSAYKMTPHWLADPWWGVILQPQPTPEVDQNAWLIVRVPPSLGNCTITDIRASNCPFGAHLAGHVTITGHFDDPVARTCQSRPFDAGGDPGPSKKQMIARCRAAFVVTAIVPAP
jgi:hypothetical protein